MVIENTNIEDVLVITPKVFNDDRGYFYEVFNDKEFNEKTDWKYNFHTLQVNESHSVGNVLRGLHFQRDEHAQAKIVRCTEGCVIDFAVDIREDSPTYGKFEYLVLTQENKKMFFVPKGFAHGFLVLSDWAEFCYKCTDFYNPGDEGGLAWNDPSIGIEWPELEGTYQGNAGAGDYHLKDGTPLNLSEKDTRWDVLANTYCFGSGR